VCTMLLTLQELQQCVATAKVCRAGPRSRTIFAGRPTGPDPGAVMEAMMERWL
jgi:hypothetical protein